MTQPEIRVLEITSTDPPSFSLLRTDADVAAARGRGSLLFGPDGARLDAADPPGGDPGADLALIAATVGGGMGSLGIRPPVFASAAGYVEALFYAADIAALVDGGEEERESPPAPEPPVAPGLRQAAVVPAAGPRCRACQMFGISCRGC